MKPIRIFTHIACEPPGYLADLLDKLGYPYEQVCLYDGVELPVDLDSVSGLVIMGGPGNVNQPTGWMAQEIELIRMAYANDTPILGICLGAQLMSKALGGDVHQGQSVEVGWHQVQLLPAASSSPYFTDAEEIFQVFQWHAHVFSPPPFAEPLAISDCTECQAYTYNNSLAVQFHLEMTEEIIRDLIQRYGSDLEGDSSCVQNRGQILEDISNKARRVNAMADIIFTPWFRSLID
ncbi:MAG: type 1 glutamine amidotransferase [Gammaproteobacteria bacterium]|nr:type 1 glutamine amidotransferase [Gammaproteobacteria bacterium]